MNAISNADELRATYMMTFDAFAVTPSDVAEELSINTRFARELLGTLGQASLVVENENGDGDMVWQTSPDTYDNISREEAETRIDKFLKSKPKADKAEKAPRVKKEETFHDCYCGCGENVPSKSFYRPGHDARHAGMVGRYVAANFTNVSNSEHYSDLPSERLVAKAKGIAQKAVDKEAAKAERAAAKANKDVVETGVITVGKNTVPATRTNGEVVREDGKPVSKTAAATFAPAE